MRRHRRGRLAWVKWYAEDALNGVALLSPMEELAYRRLLDYIVTTADNLPNDDVALARITKAGRQWRIIKTQLLVLGKIEIDGEFIRNKRMSAIIKESLAFSEKQARRARGRNGPDDQSDN